VTETGKPQDRTEVKIWDPFVRVSHWTIVVAFTVAYLTEDDATTLHSWAGYLIIALVVLRVLWGLVGPRHARFSDFVYRPVKVRAYLKDLLLFRAKRYLGHSPAGGAMTLALWAMLLLTCISGVALLAVEEKEGPLAPWLAATDVTSTAMIETFRLVDVARADDDNGDDNDNGGGEALEALHEILSNLTLALIFLHIAGVGWSSLAHRENLPRSMVTGRKRALEDDAGD
jgi:cytochrome b